MKTSVSLALLSIFLTKLILTVLNYLTGELYKDFNNVFILK